MTRSSPFSLALAAMAAVMLLAACTTEGGAPGDSSDSGTKSSSPGSDESTPGPIEAVLVVASVDPDGKNVTASGYVQGVVRDSGTCVFTFTGEGSEFTMEQPASADRMTTSCGTVQVPIEKFTRGSWKVTVGMDVDGPTYTSDVTTVEVP